MATQYLKLTGELIYARNLTELDTYNGDSKWKCNLLVDSISKEDMERFKASGCRVSPRTDKYGNKMLTFSRNERKMIKDQMIEFEPPQIFGVEAGTFIGDGTKVEATIDVYDTRNGKGHRFRSVKVLNLVDEAEHNARRESFNSNIEADTSDIDMSAFD